MLALGTCGLAQPTLSRLTRFIRTSHTINIVKRSSWSTSSHRASSALSTNIAGEYDAEPRKRRSNIPTRIANYMKRNPHIEQHHPLCLLRQVLEHGIAAASGSWWPKDASNDEQGLLQPINWHAFRRFSPIVTAAMNFDSLGFPADHPSRAPTDTYFYDLDEELVLRSHTSVHQTQLLDQFHAPVDQGGATSQNNGHAASNGNARGSPAEAVAMVISGDVYRRDTIDAVHFPVFHQMEALKVYNRGHSAAIGTL